MNHPSPNQPVDLPKHLAGKFCPHIPPAMIPEPDSVLAIASAQGNPAGINVKVRPQFFECQGPDRCAQWGTCQGDYSPAKIEERSHARIDAHTKKLTEVWSSIKAKVSTILPMVEAVYPASKVYIPIISRFLSAK